MARRTNKEDLARIGDLVRRHRAAARLSMEALAARAPMSPVTWRRVEEHQTVRPATYAGVEAAFGWQEVAIDRYLQTGVEPPVAEPRPIPDLQSAIDDVLAADISDDRKVWLIRALREVEEIRRHRGSAA